VRKLQRERQVNGSGIDTVINLSLAAIIDRSPLLAGLPHDPEDVALAQDGKTFNNRVVGVAGGG